jgi:hypothetical protein
MNKSSFNVMVLVVLVVAALTVTFFLFNNSNSDTDSGPLASNIQSVATLCETQSKPLPVLQNRNELGALLEKEGLKVGVEIGVQRGGFAEITLGAWTSASKYYLIDPWKHQNNYADGANVNNNEQEQILNEAKHRLAKHGDKVVFLRKFSTEAVDDFEDESVDFVYVDARHDYNGVMQDMTLFYPKLKKGGIMAGHDYVTQEDVLREKGPTTTERWDLNEDGSINPGAVKGAVNDFADKNNKQLILCYRESMWYTWYFRK